LHPVNLSEDGSLQEVYRPAIYLDTNFLRHYYNAEGAECCVDDEGNDVEPLWASDFQKKNAREQMLWDIICKRDTYKYFALLRRYAINDLTKASLIITPIAVLELFKLHAEVLFKEICAGAVGVKRVQKWGDRDVGKYLTDIFQRSLDDKKQESVRSVKEDCTFNLSFAECHGLQGTFYVNDLRFRITEVDVANYLWVPSFLQLDTTDILHIHASQLLGCDYLASLDRGFSRNKKIIESFTKFKILCSVEEVMEVMKRNRKRDTQ
jgi:hypothetical protein